MENESSTSSKPVKTFRYRGISAAIFENHTENGDLFHKVQIVRNYKTENGFESTPNYSRADLPVVIYVCQQAFDFILCAERDAREKQNATEKKK